MLRWLAINVLMSTFGEAERRALQEGAANGAKSGTAASPGPPPKVNPILRRAGRLVGRSLSPRSKARIQDFLINRYRIPMRLVPPAKLRRELRRALEHLTEHRSPADLGDFLEFGVYQGTSMASMHRVLERLGIEGMRLFGFDSFEGLPSTAEEEGVWSAGQYRADIEFTRDRLTEAGIDWNRTFLVKGFFSETLTEETRRAHAIERASVIMLDCDLYSSTVEALEWCYPLIQGEAVLIFDDWNSTGEGEGQKRAWAEFLAAHPELEAEEFGSYSKKSQIFRVSKPAR